MTIESAETINTTRMQDGQASGSITPSDVRVAIDSLAGVAAISKSADYTCALADRGTCLEMNSSSNFSFFINTDAAVAFDVGTVLEFCRMGTGTVTIAATNSGTTSILSPTGTATLRARYSHASARKQAANVWVLAGDLT